MKQVMVRYKVKPEQASHNEALARSVYEALDQLAPAGLQYATYVLEDGVSFVHLATFSIDGDNPLQEVPAFRAFTESIASRVDDPPVVVELRRIGSYGPVAN